MARSLAIARKCRLRNPQMGEAKRGQAAAARDTLDDSASPLIRSDSLFLADKFTLRLVRRGQGTAQRLRGTVLGLFIAEPSVLIDFC